MAARPTHSVSGPAPSARARQPVIPHMRAAKTIGVPGTRPDQPTWAGNESCPARIRADQHLCSGHPSQPAHPPSRPHWSTLAVIGHRPFPYGPRTAQAASSAAEDSASILRVSVMQDWRPGQCGLPDVASDLQARRFPGNELEYRHQETEPADRFVGCYAPQIVAVAETWLLSTDSMCRSPNRP
jgi:hypothetical protein